MDYLIAQDLIRTEGAAADLVNDCRLIGFRPFERPDVPLALDQFNGYRELDRFEFDEAVADCHFGRCDGGYLFYMLKQDCPPVIFAKADGDTRLPAAVSTATA